MKRHYTEAFSLAIRPYCHIANIGLVITCFLHGMGLAQYGGGNGSPDEPHLIYTAGQLDSIGVNPGDWHRHFRLMTDIDLSDIQRNEPLIPSFKGTFNGEDYIISNLTVSIESGLFGSLAEGAIVKNLGIVELEINVSHSSIDGVGGLVRRRETGHPGQEQRAYGAKHAGIEDRVEVSLHA